MREGGDNDERGGKIMRGGGIIGSLKKFDRRYTCIGFCFELDAIETEGEFFISSKRDSRDLIQIHSDQGSGPGYIMIHSRSRIIYNS